MEPGDARVDYFLIIGNNGRPSTSSSIAGEAFRQLIKLCEDLPHLQGLLVSAATSLPSTPSSQLNPSA